MNPSEDNPTCQKCGLYKGCRNPFMKANGAVNPRIIIVGEAPGEEESKQGKPFVGQSGQLLRRALEGLGIDIENDVLFTNVVRCRPPENKITKQAINFCKQFAKEEIEYYPYNYTYETDYEARLEQVWLMGNSPLQGILGESGITSWAGVKVEKDGITYLPLYHPAYILRDMGRIDEWLDHMEKGLNGDEKSDRYEIIIPKTLKQVLDMQSDLHKFEYISFDTELSGLDPFADTQMLLSVSFARPGRAYSIPLDHPETSWTDEQLAVAGNIIAAILMEHDGKVICHNAKFDQNQARALLDCDFKVGGDTMIMSHLINSQPGIHGLKHLAGLHLGLYEYEQELTLYIQAHKECNVKNGGSYAFVPLSVLLPYGAMDAEATLCLSEKLYNELSEKQKNLYKALIQANNALAHVQFNGIKIDKFVAERYAAIYRIVQQRKMDAILADKKVIKMTKERQIDNPKFAFNPNSSFHVSDLYFKYYKIPSQGKTESGNDSTNSKLMSPLAGDYPIIGLIRYYKLLSKMLGTYLEPALTEWLSADGRVRSTYNMHGTVTGRMSSSNPNLQNIPTPEKEPGTLLETLPIKNIFTHSNGILLALDYSGMELRVFASQSNCKGMIDIHKSGRDFHSMVAIMAQTHKALEDITDEDIKALPKPVRYRFKWTNWTLLYGGDAHTLSGTYDIPLDEAEETVRMYFDFFPEVLEFQKQCVEFAKDNGYIESVFGRREYLPYINDRRDRGKANQAERAAKNMPIQSAASDTLTLALAMMDAELSKAKLKSLMVNTVHDSVLLDCYLEELEQAHQICVDVMENVAVYGKTYMPQIDFSWLKVPLKADADVGTHYGSMEEYEKWMSKNKHLLLTRL